MRIAETSKDRGSGNRELFSSTAVCIWIPLFALRCEIIRRPTHVQRPTALLSSSDTRRLWQVSSLARRAGVKAAMTVNQAIGLCPTLTLYEPDPVFYDERFSHIIMELGNVSPVIEPVELGHTYVGVDGLETLFGSPKKQLETIVSAISSEWSSTMRLGWGRGKFVAWVAATRAEPGGATIVLDKERKAFLASQPVAVLQIDADTHRRVRQLGLKTLRDVARLPEIAVISQFGNEGRRIWQLATGTLSEPVVGRETPDPIVSKIHFPNPVADKTMLIHALDRLIDRTLRHPRRIGWRVLEVLVRAKQEHGSSWMIRATLKEPSADRQHIAAPLRVRLEQIPPTGAIEDLTVEFVSFARGTTELQLFARDANSAARAGRQRALRYAVREIRLRVRRSSLYHVVEVQPWSRIPERRYALIDYDP